MTRDEAIRKAKKLLRLGQSDNPHEAALAMARAQSVLARFEIELADVEGQHESSYTEEGVSLGKRNIVHWRRLLLSGLSRINGVYVFRSGTELILCGESQDIERTRMLFQACADEVERLCRQFGRGRGRSFANSFKMGAASMICDEARAEMKRMQAEMQSKVSSTALVVLDTRLAAARDEARSRRPLVRGGYGGSTGSGYREGRNAATGSYGRATRSRVGGGSQQLRG